MRPICKAVMEDIRIDYFNLFPSCPNRKMLHNFDQNTNYARLEMAKLAFYFVKF